MARHLLVTNDFAPKTGGIQVYLEELWRRLEVGRAVVLTASSHPDAAAFDRDSDLEILRVPASTLYLPTPRAKRAIEAAIVAHDPELVLLDPAWPLGLLGPSLSRPYGVILHGAEVTIPARLPVVASSLRHVLRHARVAVAAGAYVEGEARRCAAEHTPPILQVPPGVDTSRFAPPSADARRDERARLGLADGELLVTSYSRLVPRKGMDTLIRASALLAGDFPNLRVQIGGAGRDAGRLEKLVRRLHAPVQLIGRVADDELVGWLGASDLMVMDCRRRWLGLEQEGFGIVFVEAGACGVATVAGRSGGSHEAVEDGVTGVVVDNPRDPRALAGAMATLLRDAPRREVLGAQAARVVRERFDWDVLAARLGAGLADFDGAGRHVT
ncbi:MAG: glycosyltransferase family 4 protein [Acidobacteriota bacterium]|nr:glycosyltransferase family 4 protein [Acidobacteriota bacterium]